MLLGFSTYCSVNYMVFRVSLREIFFKVYQIFKSKRLRVVKKNLFAFVGYSQLINKIIMRGPKNKKNNFCWIHIWYTLWSDCVYLSVASSITINEHFWIIVEKWLLITTAHINYIILVSKSSLAEFRILKKKCVHINHQFVHHFY
jgi:hypothetical protein